MKFNRCLVTAFLFLALAVQAQTTAFTYQGQLDSNNVPATGSYDFRFQICNANSNGVAVPLTTVVYTHVLETAVMAASGESTVPQLFQPRWM